ncbi:MAG TPA: DUF881 domain-containing protein [Anaerovoracaceae bacterium]|nr:DUF881 domain-containing protein [Anaerovoracaceae bacterium]
MKVIKKNGSIITVGLLALFIGLILSVQISTNAGSDQGGLVPLGKLTGYEAELSKVKEEKAVALQQLIDLEKRIADIESNKAEEDTLVSGMVSDLEKYRMFSGVVDVQGPGVFITINDPVADKYQEDYSIITNNFDLLLGLVNRLKEAGAEAISINEQRISNTTEISLAGSNVNINGTPTAPPYFIKAIGNPQTLDGAINLRGGIIYIMKAKYNLVVDTEIKDKILIGRYNDVINFKYAEPIPEAKN